MSIGQQQASSMPPEIAIMSIRWSHYVIA